MIEFASHFSVLFFLPRGRGKLLPCVRTLIRASFRMLQRVLSGGRFMMKRRNLSSPVSPPLRMLADQIAIDKVPAGFYSYSSSMRKQGLSDTPSMYQRPLSSPQRSVSASRKRASAVYSVLTESSRRPSAAAGI